MMVSCLVCGKTYDDAERWTICPHNPLSAGHRPEDFCFRHDMFGPCPFCRSENIAKEAQDADRAS